MQTFSRHSWLVLLFHLAGSILIEFAHHDVRTIALNARPVVGTHACGEKELHIPLDQARHCLACSPLAQRFSTAAIQTIGLEASRLHLVLLPSIAVSPSEPDVMSSGKRGPPSA